MTQDIGTATTAPVDLPPEVPEEVQAVEPETPEEPKQEAPVEEPKPRSGFARQKIKLARQDARILEQDQRIRYLESQLNGKAPDAKPLSRPEPEQFTDWKKYQDAQEAYDNERISRIVAEQQARQEARQAQQRQIELRQDAFRDFREDCEEFNQEFPDAEAAASALKAEIGSWKPHVLDLMSRARNREVIHYYLTKNPDLAVELNGMDPVSAALTIGELQAKAELPTANKVSKAPPPITPPRGGASAPSDPYQAAKKDDITQYVRMRMAMDKKE